MMNKQKYYISVVYHNVMRGLAIYCGLILGIIVILKLTGDRYGIVSILVLLEYVGIAFLLVYGIGFFIDGYYIQDEKIVYYHNFKRRKKDLSEVKSVIISNIVYILVSRFNCIIRLSSAAANFFSPAISAICSRT